ncbi:MAG: hypothetical protein RLZZ196_1854 [Bacteroidota bacterium]|jgi:hypothetical protein
MVENLNIIGNWNAIIETPFGESKANVLIKTINPFVSGTVNGENGSFDFDNGTFTQNTLVFSSTVDTPIKATLYISVLIEGEKFTGTLTMDEYMTVNIRGFKNVNL